jgi:ribonucleoside-triphosphate reductase
MVKTGAGREHLIKSIKKRDGQEVPFDLSKIAGAINKAMIVTGEGSMEEAELVANKVLAELVRIAKKFKDFLPDVEGIQDIVEKELILSEYVRTAKEYILYRQERSKLREVGIKVPPKVKKLTQEVKNI